MVSRVLMLLLLVWPVVFLLVLPMTTLGASIPVDVPHGQRLVPVSATLVGTVPIFIDVLTLHFGLAIWTLHGYHPSFLPRNTKKTSVVEALGSLAR